MSRQINKESKNNIKCEHCEHWAGLQTSKCKLSGCEKQYYCRCKKFEWSKRLVYKECE